MILAWDNQGDLALISAGSEKASLPASNVQQPHLSRQWHTLSGVTSSYLIFDRGSATSCSLAALLGTNLTPAATVRWRASTLDATVQANLLLDTGIVSAGVKAGYGASYKTWAAVSARYWRVDIADAALPDNIQVGRVFLGPSWTHDQSLIYGWQIAPLDESQVTESWGGQSYADARPKRRQIAVTLDYLSEAEMYDNVFAMARARGVVSDLLVIPQQASAYISEQSVWGRVTVPQPVIHRASRIYRQQFTVKERL